MSVITVRLQAEIEQHRWQQTLEAMESAVQGKVVEAEDVHGWLASWGTDAEQNAPSADK